MKRKKVINWTELGNMIKANFNTILSIVSLLVTIWIGRVANELTIAANTLNERNQAIDIDAIELIDDNEDYYLVHPDVSQGKIKKAYLVSNTEEGIIYTELEPSIDDFKIDKQTIDVHEVKVLDLEAGVTDVQNFAEQHGAKINDIVDFGLVFLDCSNHWSFNYVFIRPSFVFSEVVHESTVTKQDGSPTTYTYTCNYVAEQELLVIDTALINVDTLEKMLGVFNDYDVTAYSDKETEKIENLDDTNMIIKGSELSLFIPYTFREANEMMDIINSVKNDLY